jgi:DNA-binding XRE family transcriptional regulator
METKQTQEEKEDTLWYQYSCAALSQGIKDLRKKQGLTQVAAAKLAGVSRLTIINAEKNKVKLETLYKIKNNIEPANPKFPWIKKVMLGVCLIASSFSWGQANVKIDITIGMTASLRPAANIRAYVNKANFEGGLCLSYPTAINAHLGRRFKNATPYIGIGSEGPVLGCKWHCFNILALDGSISGQNIRVTFGWSLF